MSPLQPKSNVQRYRRLRCPLKTLGKMTHSTIGANGPSLIISRNEKFARREQQRRRTENSTLQIQEQEPPTITPICTISREKPFIKMSNSETSED